METIKDIIKGIGALLFLLSILTIPAFLMALAIYFFNI